MSRPPTAIIEDGRRADLAYLDAPLRTEVREPR